MRHPGGVGVAAVAAVLLMGTASSAEAARWRRGKPPAGITYTKTRTATNGTVCYYTNETGTNECRWKSNWGCKWMADSGVNQCTPGKDTTPVETVTLAASNGTVTIASINDGDANPATMAGTITVKRASTGEIATGKIRVKFSPTDIRLSMLVGAGAVALQAAQGDRLPGDATYRPFDKTPTGWQVGGTAPPGGGSTCGSAWSDWVSSQLNCYGDHFAESAYRSFINTSWATAQSGFGCLALAQGVAIATAGGMFGAGSLAAFAGCEAGNAGNAFAWNFVRNVFGDNMPVSVNCNGVAQVRMLASQYCDPRW